MTVSLRNNFLLNARGLTFEDTASISWTFNANLNQLTATALSASAATSLAGGGAGSLPYQSATNVTAFLAAASNGSLLTLAAGVPSWEAVPTWNQNTTGTAANVTGVVAGANGGTGIANAGKTLTIGGNVMFSGAFTFTGTLTATTAVTFPTSGMLATTAQVPTAANPSASVGLAVVNGVATTYMRSDGSPALSQAIVPTWSGLHIFNAGLQFPNGQPLYGTTVAGAQASMLFLFSDHNVYLDNGDTGGINFRTSSGTIRMSIASGGAVTVAGNLGVNNVTPPAKVTGWGTPTGQAVVASFAAGATPSLLQMSEAVAQIITDLKNFGIYGA